MTAVHSMHVARSAQGAQGRHRRVRRPRRFHRARRGAAEVYAALELTPLAEARARLDAGRDLAAAGRHAEADVELRRAIELYRPLRAERYLAEAEALLSSTTEATAQPG